MKIDANGTEIRVMGDVVNEDAYISLTDIAKYKNPDNAFIVVANWMRNHSTISFLGLWEQIHNPNFKPIEFDRFKAESGDNAFTLTPQQWIKATDAIGIVSKSGRYGGTYAHTDIGFPTPYLYALMVIPSITMNVSICMTQSWIAWGVSYSKVSTREHLKMTLPYAWLVCIIMQAITYVMFG